MASASKIPRRDDGDVYAMRHMLSIPIYLSHMDRLTRTQDLRHEIAAIERDGKNSDDQDLAARRTGTSGHGDAASVEDEVGA